MICEDCGAEHDGSYGSGRFCSRACQYRNIGKQSNKNGKLTGHSPTGRRGSNDWKCPFCDCVMETRRLLNAHKKAAHPDKAIRFIVVDGKRKLIGSAWNKGLTQLTDSRVKQYVTTLENRYANGELTGTFTGRTHSDETKQKIRESTWQYINATNAGPRYSIRACDYFDRLNTERGWNLQHAMNGGEIRIDRYSLDAYDKERNIVVEYDEHKHHYTNGVCQDKDIERTRIIKELLGCTFYRYIESDDVLIEV